MDKSLFLVMLTANLAVLGFLTHYVIVCWRLRLRVGDLRRSLEDFQTRALNLDIENSRKDMVVEKYKQIRNNLSKELREQGDENVLLRRRVKNLTASIGGGDRSGSSLVSGRKRNIRAGLQKKVKVVSLPLPEVEEDFQIHDAEALSGDATIFGTVSPISEEEARTIAENPFQMFRPASDPNSNVEVRDITEVILSGPPHSPTVRFTGRRNVPRHLDQVQGVNDIIDRIEEAFNLQCGRPANNTDTATISSPPLPEENRGQ